MAFNTQSETEEAVSDINVTPLVDVMLVLVVILLVTAPLLTQSVKVNLPKTMATLPDSNDQPLQLGIDAHGLLTLNKNPVADLPALARLLGDAFKRNPDTAVRLYADQAVDYGKVAAAIASIQHVGISKIGFVTLEQ